MDRTLRQFLAIADAGSITGASRALNVTQPTLTVNMQKLERELGVPLLKRTSEGISLTSYGESFRENIRMMQRLYDNAVISLKQQHDGEEHRIAIGCGYSWWILLIRDFVQSYRQMHPASTIRVNLGDQIQCMELLLSGDVSLTISNEFNGLRSDMGVHFIPLSQTLTGYFVREGHPLLEAPRTRSEIISYPLAQTGPPDNRYRSFMDEARRLEVVENLFAHAAFSFASNSLYACVDYVLDSDAVLLHSQVLAEELRLRGLYEVTQKSPAAATAYGIYMLEDRQDDPHLAPVIAEIQAAAKARLPPLD